MILIIQLWLALFVVVEIARPFFQSTYLLFAHDGLVIVAVIAGGPVISLAVESWIIGVDFPEQHSVLTCSRRRIAQGLQSISQRLHQLYSRLRLRRDGQASPSP